MANHQIGHSTDGEGWAGSGPSFFGRIAVKSRPSRSDPSAINRERTGCSYFSELDNLLRALADASFLQFWLYSPSMLPVDQIALFFVIGIIVSLDVVGLTAAKAHTYTGTKIEIARWAQRNAFWHAFLLFVYGVFAVGLFDKVIKDGLDWLIERLPAINLWPWAEAIIIEVRTHFSVTFALVSICIVWAIYRSKVIENPLDAEKEAHEDRTQWDWQRRAIANVLDVIRVSSAKLARQMEAVAVAVDMLALALLLKSLELFKESFATVAAVSGVIYLSVFATVVCASWLLRRSFADLVASNETSVRKAAGLNRVLLLIRLCEPLLIFYFVIELLCFVVWGRMSSSSLFFVASALLTFALVRSVGFENVVNVTSEMARSLTKHAEVKRGGD